MSNTTKAPNIEDQLAESNKKIADLESQLKAARQVSQKSPNGPEARWTPASVSAPVMTRAEFEKMDHTDRNEFMSAGGRII